MTKAEQKEYLKNFVASQGNEAGMSLAPLLESIIDGGDSGNNGNNGGNNSINYFKAVCDDFANNMGTASDGLETTITNHNYLE